MLIGITGHKGVGKDLAGSFLVEQGYVRLAFADKLKEAVANLLDLPVEYVNRFKDESAEDETVARIHVGYQADDEWQILYWREFLQRFGTEMGRNTFGQNFWVEQWDSMFNALHVLEPDQARNVVVTDVRFQNEAMHIHFCGGVIIEIIRPGYTPDGHISEEPLNRALIDAVVTNDGTPGQLKTRFLATVKGLEVGVVSG